LASVGRETTTSVTRRPVCVSLAGTTSITVGARDSISAYFQWQNLGDGIIDVVSFEDSNAAPNEGIGSPDRTIDMYPNAVTFGTGFFVAPDLPGTYNRTFTLTATDPAGNTGTTTVDYEITVLAPSVETSFGIGNASEEDCLLGGNTSGCSGIEGQTLLTIGGGEIVAAYFDIRNTGGGTIDGILLTDGAGTTGIGLISIDDQDAGEAVQLVDNFRAPDTAGVYVRTITVTVTYVTGLTLELDIEYTLNVVGPGFDFNYGVSAYSVSGCGSFGFDETECNAVLGTTSTSVSAGDLISFPVVVANTGTGTITKMEFSDGEDGGFDRTHTVDVAPGAEFNSYTLFVFTPDSPLLSNLGLDDAQMIACVTGFNTGGCPGNINSSNTLSIGAGELVAAKLSVQNRGYATLRREICFTCGII